MMPERAASPLPVLDDVKVPVPHPALDRLDDVCGILDRDPLERRTHQHVSVLAQQNERWSPCPIIGVRDRHRIGIGSDLGQ